MWRRTTPELRRPLGEGKKAFASTKSGVRLAEQGTADVVIEDGGKIRAGWDGSTWGPPSLSVAPNDTEVYGEVVNGQVGAQAAYGEIVVSNDATVGFHGRVIHNGTKFKVSENANVAFFGLVTGAGDFTGGGGIFFEAGYSPGNSPAWIDADADLTYGPDSINTMELGGYTEVQYDIVNMTDGGTLELNGTLNVELLDGFLPDATATFDIYRFASGDRSGSFDVVNLPQPMLDLGFDIFYLDTSVRLMSLSAAVPECRCP